MTKEADDLQLESWRPKTKKGQEAHDHLMAALYIPATNATTARDMDIFSPPTG